MEGELLGAFDDDVFAGGIPANHVVVLWSLEKAGEEDVSARRRSATRRETYA